MALPALKGDNIDTHVDPEPQIALLPSATRITAERQALPIVHCFYSLYEIKRSRVREYVGQAGSRSALRLTHRN
jgi:hypothetical protein